MVVFMKRKLELEEQQASFGNLPSNIMEPNVPGSFGKEAFPVEFDLPSKLKEIMSTDVPTYAWQKSPLQDDRADSSLARFELFLPEFRTDHLFFYLFIDEAVLSFYWPIVDRFPDSLLARLRNLKPIRPFLTVLEEYWNLHHVEPSTMDYCKSVEPTVSKSYELGYPNSRNYHNFEFLYDDNLEEIVMRSVKAAVCLMIETWFGRYFLPHLGVGKDANIIELLANPMELSKGGEISLETWSLAVIRNRAVKAVFGSIEDFCQALYRARKEGFGYFGRSLTLRNFPSEALPALIDRAGDKDVKRLFTLHNMLQQSYIDGSDRTCYYDLIQSCMECMPWLEKSSDPEYQKEEQDPLRMAVMKLSGVNPKGHLPEFM